MLIRLLCFLSVFILVSCNNKPVDKYREYDKIYDIKYSDADKFDIFEYMEIDTVFSLNLPNAEVLGMAQNCLFVDDKIIYQDFNQHIVFVFDKFGDYLYKIDRIGSGPGEYDRIYDVRLSHNNNNIIINNGKKLLFYDINNGEYVHTEDFINENNLGFTPICINTSDNTYYCWSVSGEYSLYKWSNNQLIGIKQKSGKQIITKKFIETYNDNKIIVPDYGEFGIDYLNGDKMYYINFGEKALPENLKPQISEDFETVEQTDYFKYITNVLETKKDIYISTIGPLNRYYNICIDKSTDKILKGYDKKETGLSLVYTSDYYYYALFYPSYSSDDLNLNDKLKDCFNLVEKEPYVIKFKISNI